MKNSYKKFFLSFSLLSLISGIAHALPVWSGNATGYKDLINFQYALGADINAGTKDDPHDLYYPFQENAGAGGPNDIAFARGTTVNTGGLILPLGVVANGDIPDGLLTLEITNSDSTDATYQVGLLTGTTDTYRIVGLQTITVPTDVANHTDASVDISAGETKTFSVAFGDAIGDNIGDKCKIDLDNVSSACTIVVFKHTGTVEGIGQTINESDSDFDTDNAVYIEVFVSSQIPTAGGLPAFDIARGDAQLRISWGVGATGIDQTSIRAINVMYHPSGNGVLYDTGAGDERYQELLAKLAAGYSPFRLNDETVNNLNEGTFDLKDLENGTEYRVTICIENDYGFCSEFVDDILITPAKLETFIDEQSCYLVSAGFKDEHYVLSFLRAFRDEVMQEYWPGRKFIEFYYATAPEYAMKVAKNEILSAIFRGIGYFFYGFIKYFNFIIVILLLTFFGLFIRKRI